MTNDLPWSLQQAESEQGLSWLISGTPPILARSHDVPWGPAPRGKARYIGELQGPNRVGNRHTETHRWLVDRLGGIVNLLAHVEDLLEQAAERGPARGILHAGNAPLPESLLELRRSPVGTAPWTCRRREDGRWAVEGTKGILVATIQEESDAQLLASAPATRDLLADKAAELSQWCTLLLVSGEQPFAYSAYIALDSVEDHLRIVRGMQRLSRAERHARYAAREVAASGVD